MVLLEFSISPLDKGSGVSPYVARTGVSPYVARSMAIIDESGLDYQLHAMGTVVEDATLVSCPGRCCAYYDLRGANQLDAGRQ